MSVGDSSDEALGIAIVGMSGRFPGAKNVREFWTNLERGVESISTFSVEELLGAGLEMATVTKPNYVSAAPILDEIDHFDADFFGLSPREAELLDPQQRIFLECVWEALEDAGCDPATSARTIGLYAGSSVSRYHLQHIIGTTEFGAVGLQTLIGNDKDYLASHTAYRLNLKGPAISVQTACSTSLVAVHLACTSLLNRECDVALAGGVTVRIPQKAGYLHEDGFIFSPDGHCRTFDAQAKGTVFGSGAGVVVLKRLEDALADGDPIHAVILGSAVNNDGSLKVGYTAPSQTGQAHVIAEALEFSGIDARSIQYIEAHGTGTPLGDPIELAALTEVFRRTTKATQFCAIGSVKTNVGHLETAAGIAGLIKTVLAMKHGRIPASLHFESPNPAIDFANSPFYVNASLRDWPAANGPRRAGVSSFGIGGTNAHLIIQEAPRSGNRASKKETSSCLLPLSAKTPDGLAALARSYRQWLEKTDAPLHDLAYTASVRRGHHEHRLGVVGSTREEITAALDAFMADSVSGTQQRASHPREVIFVFTGQGSQWVGMGRQLYREEPVFRDALAACDRALHKEAGFSILAELEKADDVSQLDETIVAQPALFAIEVALAALLQSWGIRPSAVIGHSVGEIAAAHVAGILDLAEAARLVAIRARTMQRATGHGKMVSVSLDEAAATKLIAGLLDRVGIAAINDPGSVVLSGETAAIDGIAEQLGNSGIPMRSLRVNYAFHSPQMTTIAEQFGRELGTVSRKTGTIAFISTVASKRLAGETLDQAYWVQNIVQSVRFADAVAFASSSGNPVFVEVGPHPALTISIERTLADKTFDSHVIPTLRRQKDEKKSVLGTLAAVYAAGIAPDWNRLHPAGGRAVELPAYPWQRKRYWTEIKSVTLSAGAETGHPLLGHSLSVAGIEKVFEVRLDVAKSAWLADHRVFGELLVPAAAFLEMARAAATLHFGTENCCIAGLTVQSPLRIAEDASCRIQVVVTQNADKTELAIYSRPNAKHNEGQWDLHARATVQTVEDRSAPTVDLVALRERIRTTTSVDRVYSNFAALGLDYGPTFQGIEELRQGENEALGRIVVPSSIRDEADAHGIHPAFLDAALQTLIGTGCVPEGQTLLPFEFESVTFFGDVPREAWVHTRIEHAPRHDGEVQDAAIRLLDDTGRVFVELSNVRTKRASAEALRHSLAREKQSGDIYQVEWQEHSGEHTLHTPAGTWLFIEDQPRSIFDDFATRMFASGAEAVHSTFDDFETRIVQIVADQKTLVGVVCLWQPLPNASSPVQGAEHNSIAALRVVQSLVQRRLSTRLHFVTRRAVSVDSSESVCLEQAPIWGFGRTVMQEHPELECKLIDLDSFEGSAKESLWREISVTEDENQVVFRGTKRRVARLSKVTPLPSFQARSLQAEGTVLITGGLGALGLRVARWLWEQRRCSHLLLVGRRAPGDDKRLEIEALRSSGADVTIACLDVADAAAMSMLVKSIPADKPLRGIIHAAGILDDGLLAEQNPERFVRVFAPKVRGAWNLHEATKDRTLDFFLMFSSAGAILGSAGQSNYSAANAFMDALAHARRALGLAGQSALWGAWAEGGMAAHLSAPLQARLARIGMRMLEPAEGLTLLGDVLARPEAGLMAAAIDVRTFERGQGSAIAPIWRKLVPTAKRSLGHRMRGAWIDNLAALDAQAREAEVTAAILTDIANVLSLGTAANVPKDRPLRELGLDSLMAVELRNAIARRIGQSLPVTLVFDYPTAQAIVSYLLEKYFRINEGPAKAEGLPQPRVASAEPIAIVGVGCRYPAGIRDLQSFWALLENGAEAIRDIPPERWDIDAHYDANPDVPGKTYSRRAGMLDDIADFDPAFFGISGREAMWMDPQQRLLLETSWEALENAGIVANQLTGTDTGVFVGLMYHEYGAGTALESLDGHLATGTSGSVASGRISYVLGLRGPSLTVDTACSSSLVTLHLACQSLRSGECSVALAGGVAVMLSPAPNVEFSRLRGLAPDGRCKVFDASADGVVWSEGCGMIVLKRLSDAQRDGDPILAVIRGSAVNQDGRSNGLTAPNGPSQEAVIHRALQDAGLEPSDIDYIEAHGTGTPLGDPIEVQALGAVFSAGRSAEKPLLLGAVKSNLGHTQAAAGAAGIIKVVLSLQHEAIPRTLHFQSPNPRIDWSKFPLSVITEMTPWRANGKPRRAGVSSFGMSGTNAHVILEEAPRRDEKPLVEASSYLVPLSAKTPEALISVAKEYRNWLFETDMSLHHAAYTATLRRTHHDHRAVAAGDTKEKIAKALGALIEGRVAPGIWEGKATPVPPKVVFVFPGYGCQWIGMGSELLRDEPVFRKAMEACDEAIRKETGWSLIEELAKPKTDSRFNELGVVQPAIFAIEVALSALWRSWGIEPSVIVGHSLGEVAAAHVAGALSLEDAAAVICRRSRLFDASDIVGAMALVELPVDDAKKAIIDYGNRLSIAVCNGPRSTVIGGEPQALDEVVEKLERSGTYVQRMKVDKASHCPQVEPLCKPILDELEGISPKPVGTPMRSTVTGELVQGPELSAAYWAANLRQPVLFSDAIAQCIAAGEMTFVEISPNPILVSFVEENLRSAKADGIQLGSLRFGRKERPAILESLGALHVRGCRVSWEKLYPSVGRVAHLPTYPWQRQRYWLEPSQLNSAPTSVFDMHRGSSGHELLGLPFTSSSHPDTRFWQHAIVVSNLPYLADHRVQGDIVFPGTGYVELALAAGSKALGSERLVLRDVAFEQLMALEPTKARDVQTVVELNSSRWSFQISSRGEHSTPWSKHAHGTIAVIEESPPTTLDTPQTMHGRLESSLDVAQFYQRIRDRQMYHGPAFQGIVELRVGENEALSKIRLPENVRNEGYFIHPAWLDACIQTSGALFFTASDDDDPYVPVGIRQLLVYARPGREAWVRATRKTDDEMNPDQFVCDLQVIDDEGNILVAIEGLQTQRLAQEASANADPLEGTVHEVEWRLVPHLAEPQWDMQGIWLVFADRAGICNALHNRLSNLGQRCIRIIPGATYQLIDADTVRLDASNPNDYQRMLREVLGDESRCAGVVHLASLDTTPFEQTTPESLRADLQHATVSAAFLAQAVVRHGFRDCPRLFVLTRGGQSVQASDPISVALAPVLGLGKTIAMEHPELACTRIDLQSSPREDDVDLLLRELGSTDLEDQIALRAGQRHVARLVRSRFEFDAEQGRESALEPAQSRPFRVEIHKTGVLERLALHEMVLPAVGRDDVLIEVEAAGLNFLDVLTAMGALPEDLVGSLEMGRGPRLGGECAGIVVAVGENVSEFSPGDEVVAMAACAFASHALASSKMCVRKPANMNWEQAATLPIVTLTAYYSLEYAARLRAGERVLIHAGAGGVGIVAIQWAKHVGAEIFATAGSEEKRAYLRSLGVHHVLDSRSLRFAEEIKQITHGDGVDVVLNSLSGDFIPVSLGLLRDYGRFIEIGKRDYIADKQLGLRPFLRNLSFALVDLRAMVAQRPDLCKRLFEEVMQLFASGALTPPPVRTFAASQVVEAFQFMAQARHIGKIAFVMKDSAAQIVPLSKKRVTIRNDRTYLITGGLGGLGFSLAQWLVEQGARHLVLLGRNRPSDALLPAIRIMEDAGARVHCHQVDVTQTREVERLFATIRENLPPLAGIVHAAMVLEDHMLLEQSASSFQTVYAPKAVGAWNLHVHSADANLDFFLMYSSAAALVGSPGQSNYCAANAFLDAFARERTRRGLTTMSIQWGGFSDVGLAAAADIRGKRLSYRGAASFTPAEGLEALGRLLANPRPEVGVMRFNSRQWIEFYPSTAGVPFFAELMKQEATQETKGEPSSVMLVQLRNATRTERQSLLEQHIMTQLATVLRIDPSRIDRTEPFQSMGMDSLMSLELRNRLEANLGLKLSATILFTYASTAALGERLLELLNLSEEPPVAQHSVPTATPERTPENMNDVDIFAFFDSTVMDAEKL